MPARAALPRHDINVAFPKGYDTDASAFGVIIALNKECTVIAKKSLIRKFLPRSFWRQSYEAGVLEILKQKPNIRVINCRCSEKKERVVYRSAFDGMLVQVRIVQTD